MLIALLSGLTFAATPGAPACTAQRLNACASGILAELQKSEVRAYLSARAVADALPDGGRVYAPSELTDFYAMAAASALRVRNSFANGASRGPGDPSDAELDARMREWAQMRCRVDRTAPWPVGIGLTEQGTLDSLCAPEKAIAQTTVREIWLDGAPVAGGATVNVPAGAHVIQYMDGTSVVTLVRPVAEGTAGFGVPPLPPAPLAKPHRSPARWPLAVGGTLLVGGGAAGLIYWGTQVGGDNQPDDASQKLMTGLSLAALGTGTAALVTGVALTSEGAVPTVGIRLPI